VELERILITELRYFGDVLLTTPLIGFLRKKYPNARIDALVYHSTREMLTGNSITFTRSIRSGRRWA